MPEAIIGALRVVLGMDSARFEKGLKDAEKSTNTFAKNMTAVAVGIGLERHLTRAVESFVGSFKTAITSAERFGEMAQQFGVPVEQLSALKHSADLSGVSLETLGTSMGRLSKAVFEAADGVGPTAVAFRALGVEIKNEDGTLKSNNETLLAVSDAFSKMEDGAQKTALAMAIFGRGGAALLPLLNQGSQALRDQTEEARKFGLVISTETAVAADRFMDTLDKIGKVWVGSVNVAVAQALPLLQLLADRWLNIGNVQDTVHARGRMMADMFASLATRVTHVVETLLQMDIAIDTTAKMLRQGLELRFAEAGRKFDEGVIKTRELKESFEQLRAEMFLSANAISLASVQVAVYGEKAGVATAATQKLSAAARDMLQVTSEKAGQVPLGTSTLENVSSEMMDLPEKVGRVKRAYSELTDQIEGNSDTLARFAKDVRTPFEEIQLEIAKVNTLMMTATPEAAEILAKKMEEIAGRTRVAWGSAFASLAGSISTAFEAIAGENKQMLAIAKVAGAAQALINAYVAASRALAEGGPFAGPVFAASILAAGLGFVAQINAIDFAQGGSFTVGGAGGIDSQSVMMNLTPGERVDVHKPSNAGNRDLVVRGIRPRDLFTGEMVREMVLQFDDWVKHGGTGMRHER